MSCFDTHFYLAWSTTTFIGQFACSGQPYPFVSHWIGEIYRKSHRKSQISSICLLWPCVPCGSLGWWYSHWWSLKKRHRTFTPMWPQLGGTKISVSTQHQTWQWEIHLITYKLWFRHVSTEKASLNGGFSIATFDCRLVITLEYGKVQVSSIKYQQVEFSSACPHNHGSLLCKFVMCWCRPFLISVLETLSESYGMLWCGTLKSSVFECCFNKLPAGFPLEVTFFVVFRSVPQNQAKSWAVWTLIGVHDPNPKYCMYVSPVLIQRFPWKARLLEHSIWSSTWIAKKKRMCYHLVI